MEQQIKWSKEELEFLVKKYFDYKNNLINKKEITKEFKLKFPERNNLSSINLKFYNIEHLAPYIINEFKIKNKIPTLNE